MEDLTGQTLGQYEITHLLGVGGMATVYRARQPRLKRDVAVKVMLPALAADATFRERFEREAQAIANLHHPSILTVYDYGETGDGQLYLVVEYVPGGTLRERLAGEMPLEEAIEVVAQVAEALDYAHRQGVIHRDVKPNNILLTHDGRPLLADFGLVKPVRSERNLTASGVMLGTPDYVAPEQAQGLEIDGRADIYALGVVLFETLTGHHPFTAESPISVMIKHISEPMPRPSELNPAISPALDEVVAKATAKSPDERYQRAGEMARALRAALASGVTLLPGEERIAPRTTPAVVTPPAGSPLEAPALAPLRPIRPWYRKIWVRAISILVLALVAVLIFAPMLSEDGEEGLPGAMPTARPDETMILITQFKAKAGSESYDVSQRIYNKLADDLRQLGEEEVTVYQVPDVVESSEAAITLGRQYNATTVIWGFYDDIGISPNIEAVATPEDNLMSVGLERVNLDAADMVNFKLYIAKDLPEELSFLTAVSLGQAFLLQGRLEKAVTYILLAADNLPADPQFRGGGEMLHFFQAMMAMFQGNAEKGIEHMNQAIAINPDKALLYSMRGTFLATSGAVDEAFADLERALSLDPDDLTALGTKAYVAWALGDPESALSFYDRIIELEPDEAMGFISRGQIRFEMGDLTTALEELNKAAEISPASALVSVARGLTYEKAGQSQLAEAEYARAREEGIRSNPLSQFVRFVSASGSVVVPKYYFLLQCVSSDILGNSEEALKWCDKALDSGPAYADALWKRGQLYAEQGEWEAALVDYTAAIEADPTWPWVYYLRAQALIQLGRTDEAQADLRQALELEPADELRQQIQALQGSGSQ